MTDSFPVLQPPAGCPKSVKLSALNETMAQRNHGQTLKRLAERGGLDPREIYANAHMKAYRDIESVPIAAVITFVTSITI